MPSEVTTPGGALFPVRPAPAPGQALDSYLEHVADANYITSAALLTHLKHLGGNDTYLIHAPTPRTLAVIAALTGQDLENVIASTLRRYDGLAYSLEGIDPEEETARRAATYRKVAARGWLPARTSQICPSCLAEDSAWMLSWHLPGSTLCLRHSSYLQATCPGCQRPFRSNRAAPLRAVGPSTVCGNPLGQGPREQCQVDLTRLPAVPAPQTELRRQERFEAALQEHTIQSFLGPLHPKQYLDLSRSMTVLLLHLAGQPGASTLHPWAEDVIREAASRNGQRGPRWGIAPPIDPVLRSQALTAAETIIDSPNLDTAIASFRSWYELTPPTADGPLGWLTDRTRMTPELTRLLRATHTPRQRLSARLDTSGAFLPLFAIPQAIPTDLYIEHVAHLMGCSEDTGRCFVSLALARGHGRIHTWEEAAAALGLPKALGPSVVRAVTQRLNGSTDDLHDAIRAVGQQLDPHTSWRLLEDKVFADAVRVADWLPSWAATHRPGMKETSAPYAITWRWIHDAGGLLETSPAWESPPTRRQRAAYRQFAVAVDRRQAALNEAIGRQTAAVQAVLDRVDSTGDLASRAPRSSQAHMGLAGERHPG